MSIGAVVHTPHHSVSPQRKIAIVNIRSFTIGRIVPHLSSHNKSQPLVPHFNGASLVTVNKRKLGEAMLGAAAKLASRGGGPCVTKTVPALGDSCGEYAGLERGLGTGPRLPGCASLLLSISSLAHFNAPHRPSAHTLPRTA